MRVAGALPLSAQLCSSVNPQQSPRSQKHITSLSDGITACSGRICISRAVSARRAGESMQLPRYDKAAHSGAGDRAPQESWPSVAGPVDIVLFEGWMLGFTAKGPRVAAVVELPLGAVDEYLAAYKAMWDCHVHAWLVVAVDNPRWVFKWRQEAEAKLRAEAGAGMTDEQVEAFVERYMPAYTAYLPTLYESGPTTCRPGRWLKISVDELRCLKSAEAR